MTLIEVLIVTFFLIDFFAKFILLLESNEEYCGETKSKNQLAWKIIYWIIPFTWVVIFIRFAAEYLKKFFNWWNELPEK